MYVCALDWLYAQHSNQFAQELILSPPVAPFPSRTKHTFMHQTTRAGSVPNNDEILAGDADPAQVQLHEVCSGGRPAAAACNGALGAGQAVQLRPESVSEIPGVC